MSHSTEPINPTRAVASRVKEVRQRHGWSAQQLADEMTGVGMKWDRFVVQNLESGRRQAVSLDELLALAYVLDVAPVHLMVPTTDDSQFYAVTPEDSTPAVEAREWICGRLPIGNQDPRLYFSEVPLSQWEPPKMSDAQIAAESERIQQKRAGDASR